MVPRSFAPPTVELPGSKNTPAPPASSTPNGVSFPDTNTGIVVGGGPILRTTDGGVTWERLSSGLPEWGWFYAVSFSSANIGTVIRTYGSIYGTTDGGKTWTWQFNALSQLNAVSFADGNTGFAVGDGAGMRTIDGGASWTYYQSLYNCHGISFANPKTGIAVGSGGFSGQQTVAQPGCCRTIAYPLISGSWVFLLAIPTTQRRSDTAVSSGQLMPAPPGWCNCNPAASSRPSPSPMRTRE